MALIDGRILNAESYALMTQPRKLTEGRVREYGCGIGVKIISNTLVLAHKGEVSGYEAWNVVVPATKSAVVLLFNGEETETVDNLKAALANLIMPDPPLVPAIAGPDAGQAAMEFFRSFQAGRIDRSRLGEEFSRFMSEDKVRDAAMRLKKFGAPVRAEVQSRSERGGMEVAHVRLTCKKGTLSAFFWWMAGKRVVNNFLLPRPGIVIGFCRATKEPGSKFRLRDLVPGRQDLFARRILIPLAGASISFGTSPRIFFSRGAAYPGRCTLRTEF